MQNRGVYHCHQVKLHHAEHVTLQLPLTIDYLYLVVGSLVQNLFMMICCMSIMQVRRQYNVDEDLQDWLFYSSYHALKNDN